MSTKGDAIGMMDGAYFVGRKEILDWLNNLLSLNLAKIEETAPGHVACQLLDVIFPGTVPMHRVQFDAKHEHEYVNNYKIIQKVFNSKKVDKVVEVARLTKGRYMDNLEFMQWFKKFYELNVSEEAESSYDPVGRRSKSKGGGAAAAARAPAGERRASGQGSARSSEKEKENDEPAPKASSSGYGRGNARAAAAGSTKKVQALERRAEEMKATIDGLERERDFYFGKLRDIEILLQNEPDAEAPLVKSIFKILYATEDDFVAVDEAGNPIEEEGKPTPVAAEPPVVA